MTRDDTSAKPEGQETAFARTTRRKGAGRERDWNRRERDASPPTDAERESAFFVHRIARELALQEAKPVSVLRWFELCGIVVPRTKARHRSNVERQLHLAWCARKRKRAGRTRLEAAVDLSLLPPQMDPGWQRLKEWPQETQRRAALKTLDRAEAKLAACERRIVEAGFQPPGWL